MSDLAFTPSKNGKLTFARDAKGNPFLDSRGLYAVYVCLASHKTKYGWSTDYGTRLHTITSDGRATSSRINAQIVDAFAQLQDAGLVRNGSGQAERLRSGAWKLALSWESPEGEKVTPTISQWSAEVGTVSATELKAALIGAFPPGSDTVIDWGDSPGAHMGAVAKVLQKGVDAVDLLRVEVNPLTMTQKLGEWERALGLGPDAAALADVPQRRRAVTSRFREIAATTTKPNVQAIIAPLLAYSDPSSLAVVEVSAAAIKTAHSYIWEGSQTFSGSTVIGLYVRDDAKVSDAGAVLDIEITHTDVSVISCDLIAPDNTAVSITAGSVGRGAASTTTYRLYFPTMAGVACGGREGGLWRFAIRTDGTTTGTLTSAKLYIDGIGRPLPGQDALGAVAYRWCVCVEDAKLGSGYNIYQAREALQRINYAARFVALARRSVGAGALAAGDFACVVNDPNCVAGCAIVG